jgi:peptidoglycan/LPS O-acetylase OafA/YrhL
VNGLAGLSDGPPILADERADSVHPRYASLDAWRGAAALSVVLFHCGNSLVTGESLFGRALLAGWMGVFLFFPISGYCILGALRGHENGTLGAFLTRRWQRIVLPYWASIAFALLVALAALPFNTGSLDDLTLTPGGWVAMLTLTQVFTTQAGAINPVYWSLCYEEQFYLVMGLLLFMPSRLRPAALAALTCVAAIYVSGLWPWRIEGLFLEYWVCFAVGCGAYLWLHAPGARTWALTIFGIGVLATVATANVALAVSVAAAIALVVLAPADARLARSIYASPLAALGLMSYSLYLVHVPVGGRLANLLDRLSWPTWAIVPAAATVSIVAAYAFYVVVECRTRPVRQAPTTPSVPNGPVAQRAEVAA